MKNISILSIAILFFLASCNLSVKNTGEEQLSNVESLKTFGTMGKELRVLKKKEEAELFKYEGKGCITHMWFGGSFKEVEYTDIRVYVDGEENASIDMELFLGHGIGFGDTFAPWGTERMGNIGGNSGIYNTYKIPFGKSIRITAQLAADADENPQFWWIIRGTENLPVEFGGVRLPDKARLRLHKLENYIAKPLEEFTLCDISGAGMLYQLTMEAKGLRDTGHWKDLSYMESCIRAYMGESKEPMFLSSGLEDYFLGTYYFNKGRYENMLAGLTHFDEEKNEFSAYRLHEEDPVFFQDGLKLTNRCGEKIGEKIYHDPPETRYTTYVWAYEW
jgi:D-arabinan exo alpha-(1,3)/(1,5)-arabinofuranosidase (non-reducing end)